MHLVHRGEAFSVFLKTSQLLRLVLSRKISFHFSSSRQLLLLLFLQWQLIDHGPQNHKAHLEKLLQYCEAGVKEGATLVYGGRQVQRPGKTASIGGVLGAWLLKLE